MDFHSLTRRELQALCKKNKIPANMTNVAMADALKALQLVEGIEELMQLSQSETAQSSTESPVKCEVTSPYVPPTGGRSTRRRNVAKEEPETVKPMTRTRRTACKTLVKDADESQADVTETPALVAHTNRKKSQMASACRKMDSQLMECVEEEKRDVSMTPAPMGVTSRRRRVKEESAVQKVYSTRRSVRLAKKNVEKLNMAENEGSELFKKELLTEDAGEDEDMNLKEALNDSDEVSGITGIDASTTADESSQEKDESEVVSAEEQDISMVQEIEGEPDQHFEADGPKPEVKENSDVENEQTGSYDVCLSEIEFTIENTEELDTEKDIGPQQKAVDFVETVVLESKDNSVDDGFSCDTGNEIEKESYTDKDIKNVHNLDVTLEKLTELRLQQGTGEVSTRKMLEDVAEADFIDHLAISVQLNKEEADKIEILQHDGSTKATADPVPSDVPYGGVASDNALIKDSPCKQLGDEQGAKGVHLDEELSHHIPLGFAAELDSQLIVQPTCLTPSKNSASEATATMKMVTAFTDNKENIGSGSTLVLVKDRVKTAKNTVESADNLNELSVRKLSKMLKEKLEITKKSTKNDSGNEQALPRPALQALPENRLVDETQN